MDSLDDLVSDGVVYSDVLAHDSDTFGRPGLRQAVQEFQAGHPLAHFTVVSHCPDWAASVSTLGSACMPDLPVDAV
jgi:PP-loop superfamily ATP-utilizing enzyme